MLANYLSIFGGVGVIPFPLELCFVFPAMIFKNVIRKFELKVNWPHQKDFSSFDGQNFKAEASSKFPHRYVYALGSYRNLPFVTGQYSSKNGLKTEILKSRSGEWEQADDYPFSGDGDRYVSNDFLRSNQNLYEDGEKTISL